ncbi:MAG: hypothetical protein IJC74_04960 [Clostridia bacterium]|nr:hypothetical protein [Clostridia bacterium]
MNFKRLIAAVLITVLVMPVIAVNADSGANTLRFLYRTDFSEYTKNYPDGVNIKLAEGGKTEQMISAYPLVDTKLWTFLHWWNVSKSEIAGFYKEPSGKSYMHLNAYNANGDYIRFKPLDKNPADVKNKLVISEIISYNTAPTGDSGNRWPAGTLMSYGSGEAGIGGGIVHVRRHDNMMFTWNKSGQSQIDADNGNIIELGVIGSEPFELSAVIDFNTNSYSIYVNGECKAENVDWMNFSGSFRNFDLYSSGSLNAKLYSFAIYDADGYVDDLTPYGGYAYRETEYAYDLDGSVIVRENGSITTGEYLKILKADGKFSSADIKMYSDAEFTDELEENSLMPDKAYIIKSDEISVLYTVVTDLTLENEDMRVEIGEFSYSAEAKKNTPGTVNATLVLGLYDSNGVMKDVDFEEISVSDTETYPIDKSCIFTNVEDGDVVDVWMFDNLSQMNVFSKVRSEKLTVNPPVESSVTIAEASDESKIMFRLDLTNIADGTVLGSGDVENLPAPGIIRWGINSGGSLADGAIVYTDSEGDKYIKQVGSNKGRFVRFGVFGVPNTYDRTITKRYFVMECKIATTSFGSTTPNDANPYANIMAWGLSSGKDRTFVIIDQDKKLKAIDASGNKIELTDVLAADGAYTKITLVFDREKDTYTAYINGVEKAENIPYSLDFADDKFYRSGNFRFWLEKLHTKDFVAYECDRASFASPADYADKGEAEEFDIPGYMVDITMGRRVPEGTKLICKYNYNGFSNEVEIPYNMQINDDNTAFEYSVFIQRGNEESVEIYMINPNDATGNKLVSGTCPAN